MMKLHTGSRNDIEEVSKLLGNRITEAKEQLMKEIRFNSHNAEED